MTLHHSTSSSHRFAKLARVVALVGCVAASGGVLRGGEAIQPAEACGWGGPTIVDLTTFDPAIVGDRDGLLYEPDVHGFGGPCDDCAHKELLAEWSAYLKEAVTAKDWERVLFQATPLELQAISARLAGKATTGPKAFDASSLFKGPPALRDKLRGAVAFVELARGVEPFANFESEDASGKPRTAVSPTHQLLVDAKNAFRAARDPFMTQRYGFQVLRTLFYQRDWAGVIGFFDKNQAALSTPSTDLTGRATYYLAGALSRSGKLARANVVLARVHANYPSLAGAAAEDFKPADDADWKQALALAKSTREKTELWRLVGLKQDGLVAAQEILKLDPKSNLVGLLLVRELARGEYLAVGQWGPPEPKDVAASKKTLATIEAIAQKQLATPGADRPWLMQLIIGHLAAKRGDVVAARAQLTAAVAGRAGDQRVADQAKASLALALALTWKADAAGLPAREDEIARTMNGIDDKFGRLSAVNDEVRGKLAKAYVAAGRIVDAEFLHQGSADPTDPDTGVRLDPKAKAKWADVAFLKEMIARTQKTTTEFDRFVLKHSHTRAGLEKELALRYLLDGDFATASATLATTKAKPELLHTDPFVIHIMDCHDCDHEQYANAKWTNVSLAGRLVELAKVAGGQGEPAAEAALALGNALYNATWHGNARVLTEGTHQTTSDAKQAERWYKRAFDLSKNRELKAKAAFLASKAELGTAIGANFDANMPLPLAKQWFPVVKTFADTKYYKEVLKECGTFSSWVASSHK